MVKRSMFLLLVSAFYIQWQYSHAASISDSIISVAMLTRHGDRAPSSTYTNDPHFGHVWPYGLAALTPKGIRQLFKSGMNKAERYKTLLQDLYHNDNHFGPKQIYVRSSVMGRCIESAKSFLDGFVPIIDKHIQIDVPNANAEDPMLSYDGRVCNNFEAEFLYDLRLDQPAVAAIVGNTNVVEYIGNHTGVPHPNSLLDIWAPCEIMDVQNDKGLELPAWALPSFHDYMQPLNELVLQTIARTKKLQVKSGVLLNDIITRWDRYMDGTPATDIQDILLYSTHDIYLQAVLALLEVREQVNWRPAYASLIALELHYNVNVYSGIEVRAYFFRNEEDMEPIALKIPACPAPCAYDKFKRLMVTKLVAESDYDQVCGN